MSALDAVALLVFVVAPASFAAGWLIAWAVDVCRDWFLDGAA